MRVITVTSAAPVSLITAFERITGKYTNRMQITLPTMNIWMAVRIDALLHFDKL